MVSLIAERCMNKDTVMEIINGIGCNLLFTKGYHGTLINGHIDILQNMCLVRYYHRVVYSTCLVRLTANFQHKKFYANTNTTEYKYFFNNGMSAQTHGEEHRIM